MVAMSEWGFLTATVGRKYCIELEMSNLTVKKTRHALVDKF